MLSIADLKKPSKQLLSLRNKSTLNFKLLVRPKNRPDAKVLTFYKNKQCDKMLAYG